MQAVVRRQSMTPSQRVGTTLETDNLIVTKTSMTFYRRLECFIILLLGGLYAYHIHHYGVSPDFDGFFSKGSNLRLSPQHFIYGKDVYHAPGYQMFLALLIQVFKFSPKAIFATQAILIISSLLLVARTIRLIHGVRVASLALAVSCFLTNLVDYSTAFFKESFTIFLMSLLIFLYVSLVYSDRKPLHQLGFAISTPFITMWCLLSNPMTLPLLAPLVVHAGYTFLLRGSNLEKKSLLVAASIFILLYSSFQVRNHNVDKDHFIAFTTNFGVNFYLGQWGTDKGKKEIRKTRFPSLMDQSRAFTRAAMENIEARGLSKWLRHTRRKMGDFLVNGKTRWTGYKVAMLGTQYERHANLLNLGGSITITGLVIPLALVSILFLKAYRGPGRSLLIAVYCSLSTLIIIPVLFYAWHRFMLPAYPLLLLASSYPMHFLLEKFLKNKMSFVEESSL